METPPETPITLEWLKKITKKVNCVTCYKEVMVKLLPFGFGHIAICPECGKLAYNGE
ncbi:MAG: hypothetical protein PHZ04_05600 [Patescibacteria group bacterium]|nr:hypothetical protein [Patescibacteria group bacterium]